MTRFINPLRFPQIKHSVMIGLGIIPVIAFLGMNERHATQNTLSACHSSTRLKSSPSSVAKASVTDAVQLTQFRRRYLDPNPGEKQSDPNTCDAENPFDQSVRYALQAANLAQTANSQQQWDEVARYWVQAVAWMQAVPPNSPQRAFAEKKVVEYMRNLTYAQEQAASGSAALAFPSFESEPLDQQLRLYLSYLSTVGTPDILIVGSSRALQGIDPQQLQQSLAAKGYQDLKIFNFGVNGATAQVVDYVLRQVLTPDQLPRMIVWADGVRAFNSGRIDRTYESILSSAGHQRLIAGVRPQLTPSESSNAVSTCYHLPQQCQKSQRQWDTPQQLQATPARFHGAASPQFQTLNLVDRPSLHRSGMLVSLNEINANGFLPLSNQYDPYTYYQRRPYVPGQYDGDYRAFNLGGEQANAFSSIMAFTETHNIRLVFVNLPLTDDYLDGFRWWAEQEFRDNMQYLSRQYGFIFIDLAEKSLTRYDYFVDPSHLNRYGARSVAQTLAANSSIPWP
jgi:hypothetical protein